MAPDGDESIEIMPHVEGQIMVKVRLEAGAYQSRREQRQQEEQAVQPVAVAKTRPRAGDSQPTSIRRASGAADRRIILRGHNGLLAKAPIAGFAALCRV